jgi:hypothetical protein
MSFQIYHVLRITKRPGLAERWGIVRMVDSTFGGILSLRFVDGEQHHRSESAAFERARQLEQVVQK